MTADATTLPPPPPPPPSEAPPAGDDPSSNNTNPPSSSSSNNTILAQACATLEKLRSLHGEREACQLFASSILAHPFGAGIISSAASAAGSNNDNNPDAEWATWGMRTSEILALQQHQQQLQKLKHNKLDAASSQFLDPLYPTLLPGSVRDAWSALVRSARPLPVSGGVVEEEADSSALSLDDYNLPDLVARGDTNGEHVIVTAAMIEKELAKEKKMESEEYTLHPSGRLSVACRTKALHAALVREGELVDLLEGEAMATRSNTIFDMARKEVEEITRRSSKEVVQHQHLYANLGIAPGNVEMMNCFYARLNDVKRYHAQPVMPVDGTGSGNSMEGGPVSFSAFSGDGAPQGVDSATAKFILSDHKRKHGHPIADGYDIASFIATETSAVRIGEVYTPEELYGLYLDLIPIYEDHVRNLRHVFAIGGGDGDNTDESNAPSSSPNSVLSYIDFLSLLSKGLNTSIPESAKLRDRRKYVRFLRELEKYLTGFLKRTSPFLDVKSEVAAKAVQSFDEEWSEKGGVDGWECRMAEASMVSSLSGTNAAGAQSAKQHNSVVGIDLSKYSNSSELEKDVSGDELKCELARLGLKCGGTFSDRAARLFLTKDTPMDKLPAKLFAKKAKGAGGLEESKLDAPSLTAGDEPGVAASNTSVVADRRVDIARLEATVTALLDQLRPTLEGTRRRIERRMTQTENERDKEIDEEINGTQLDSTTSRLGGRGEGGGNDGVDDDDDEDDAPIYNPKNVPLGWDGKPIPYWLFKLHGLNHFYPCEICGNESYRGRRNFEKHFTESRHSYGMRCLSIPNTKHFHGVTKIADALELWGRLRKMLEGNQFDVDQEEEYEDSHGNVVNRAQYEDLARKGLL